MSLGYKIALAGAKAVSRLPEPWLMAAGRFLGRLCGRLIRDRNQVVLGNLARSFPDKSPDWVRSTARRVWEHVGMLAAEVLLLFRLDQAQVHARFRYHGLENLAKARALGKGVILLTGHLGNWEWAGIAVNREVGPQTIIYRPLDSPTADRLVQFWRNKSGNRMAPKRRALRMLLRELKSGGLVTVLLDQNIYWVEGTWVDFFGRPACTNRGVALLSLASGAPAVPAHCLRAPDGFFDCYFDEMIQAVDTGDRTRDVWTNTQNYVNAVEKMVRRDPRQWLWMHKRWKTKPYCKWPQK